MKCEDDNISISSGNWRNERLMTYIGKISRYSTGILATLILLVVNGNSFIVGSIRDIPRNLSTPRSGEEAVLPDNVLFVMKFARKNHLTAIRMSTELARNRFIAQPLTEGLVPTVITPSAPIIVLYAVEALPVNCTALQVEKRLRIARCY
jgi:hypothetical protein